MIGVYLITNATSDAVYVGRSVNILHRFRQHRSCLNKGTHKNHHLQNAWKKHGENAFTFSVDSCCLTAEESVAREVELIARFKADGRAVYNVTSGGEGARHTEESRNKISRSRMGIVHTREVIDRITAQNIGRICTEEHRAKLVTNSYWRGKKRPPFTPEHRAKLRAAALGVGGHAHTEASRQKISRSKLGHAVTQETRDKISATKRRSAAERREQDRCEDV